ncbi:hypothetical protein JYU34_019528 [Plutella xylostella]|uniref:Uncharacterized protein n=1 Tax=Plutella xylostella TaxID=51655 RepID=A0ABQ7PX95_PLUXY|nr:hypothetical protein JYU34_019528 [Plutella xylostella]
MAGGGDTGLGCPRRLRAHGRLLPAHPTCVPSRRAAVPVRGHTGAVSSSTRV